MRIALAGNPNSGKTTLFNGLTKSSAHVGNYPGITVERKTGFYKHEGIKAEIIDLPGIYSLSPYSPEEVVSRNELLDTSPDVIINIVDATNLERNLYLTTQLLELGIPMVIALNMSDALGKNGMKIENDKLSKEIGVPVVSISALKKDNLHVLMRAAIAQKDVKQAARSVIETTYLSEVYAAAVKAYVDKKSDFAVFRAVKAIEGDPIEIQVNPNIVKSLEGAKADIKNDFEGDFEGMIADLRYAYIDSFIKKVYTGKKSSKELNTSDKVDRILTHRIWGIPIFLGVMFLIFQLTFSGSFLFISWTPAADEPNFAQKIFGFGSISSPGVILFNLVEEGTGALINLVAGVMPEGVWYTGLVVEALMSGVFSVISFVPQILLLFLFISILEDTGYMARIAFIMDRLLRKFGLSGRTIMPMVTCFGCAVPGIMSTRTLENDQERQIAIYLAPFFSCGAKAPIWAAFAGVLWGGAYSGLIVFMVYLLGIVVAILAAVFLSKTFIKGKTPAFIMELPSYHAPQFGNTMLTLWDRLKHYVVRAATIIAASTIVIWFLKSFGWAFWQGMVDNIDQSILGSIANVLKYVFYPLGFAIGDFGGYFVIAALTGLIAKEMVVSTVDVLGGGGGDGNGAELIMMMGVASLGGYIPAALSFMAFNLLTVPCMAAVAAARSELRSAKKFWGAIGFWMATAFVVSACVFWIAVYWWISLILVGAIAATVGVYYLIKYSKNKKAVI